MNSFALRWFGGFLALSCLASATELTRAIRLEDAPAVDAAIKVSKDINKLDAESLSPLYYAVVAGRSDWVKALLAQGAKPDLEKQRALPLCAAATNNDAVSAKLLLDAGARIGSREDEDQAVAEAEKRGATVESYGGGLTRKSHPARLAIRSGSVAVLKLLLEKEPKLDVEKIFGDDWGRAYPGTAVMDAVVHRNLEMALFLINRGCSTRIPNDPDNVNRWLHNINGVGYRREMGALDELTPVLVAAIESGPVFEPVVDRLVALGQPPVRRRYGYSLATEKLPPWDALTAAVRQGNLQRAKQFMPVPMNLEQPYRLSLLQFARNSGNPKLLEFVRNSVGGNLRPKPGHKDALSEFLPKEVDVTRVLQPRRSKVPALKEPDAPVTVAVISSPGAENPGESLSALLPSLPGWKVVERVAVEALLREKAFQTPWGDGTKQLAGLGDRLAADTLLLLSTVGDSEPALLRLEIVDVRTGLALRRIHVATEKFNPRSFTKEIAAEVVAARERFAANGGKITAVSVLDVGVRAGSATPGGLRSLVGLGLKEEIDNTPGAIAIDRRQMQPLIEEKSIGGSQTLWGSAWSLTGGLQMVPGERVKLELRATNLQDRKTVDVAVEGNPSDPRTLVRDAWAKVRAATGILGTVANPDPAAVKREAEGLVAEAEWLIAGSRPLEAVQVADAAFYLGADPRKVVPLRIRARCHSLPMVYSEDGKWPFQYSEYGHPIVGLHMLSRTSQFIELADISEHSLNEYPEALKMDVGGAENRSRNFAFASVWEALSRLVTYRLSLPEVELTPEELQALQELDHLLEKIETRLFTLIRGTANEHEALAIGSLWTNRVDLSRAPRLREHLLNWMLNLLEREGSSSKGTAMAIATLVSGQSAALRHTVERLELANLFQDRLEKSAHQDAPLWRLQMKVILADGAKKAATVREMLAFKAEMAARGTFTQTHLVREWTGAWTGCQLSRWIEFVPETPTTCPFSGDSFLPELVTHPRPCKEFFRKDHEYFQWIDFRTSASQGRYQWLPHFMHAFPRPGKLNRAIDPAAGYSGTDLLTLSYRGNTDIKGVYELATKSAKFPEREKQTLQNTVAGQPDIADDVRSFGKKQWVPEIRFRNEIEPSKRVSMIKRAGNEVFVASPNSIAADKQSKLVWMAGYKGPPDVHSLSGGWDPGDAVPVPRLIRYDVETGKSTEFLPPTPIKRPGPPSYFRIAVADGFCVLSNEQTPILAAHSTGETPISWRDLFYPEPGDRAWHPPQNNYAMATVGESVYALVNAPRAIDSPGGATKSERQYEQTRILYRLTPGADPVPLVESGRRPEQSPLDHPRFWPTKVSALDGRILLFADTRTEKNGSSVGLAYAAYDPKDGSWKAGADSAEADKVFRRDFEERSKSDYGSFLAKDGPRKPLKLAGGIEFALPRYNVPGQLKFIRKASGAVGEAEFYVPIALTVPEDFTPRFKILIRDSDGGRTTVTEELLTAGECIRSALARPIIVAQTETHFVVTVETLDLVPFPYLWYFAKADVEQSLLRQNEARK